MNRTAFRLSLASAAVFASMGLATAQMPDPQHAGTPVATMPTMPPHADMPMPTDGGLAARPTGGDMGRMMEMMRPMIAGGMGMPFEHVEGRIAYLKAELKITDAQSVLWNAFVDTMRTDATAMKAMHEGTGKAPIPTAMPDRMAARRKVMSERMAMIDRSEASVKALYAAMSNEHGPRSTSSCPARWE